MPPTCRTCRDPRRAEIDAAIVAGGSLRGIAKRFPGTSQAAIFRHKPHASAAIVRAFERRGARADETLLEKVERLEADARRLGARAEAEGDIRAALAAVRELTDVVRLLREMTAAAPAQAVITLAWGETAAPGEGARHE